VQALHLFSTKLVLKNELLQFQPSPFIFWNEEIKLLHKLAWFPMNRFINQAKLSEKIFTEFEFNSGATTNTPLKF
jgi:hypothetical protein